MRRAAHEGFSQRASEVYQPAQARGAALTVLGIIARPNAWEDCFNQCVFCSFLRLHHRRLLPNVFSCRSTATNILSAVYGWPPITPADKPIVERIHAHTARVASAVVPGRYLVDIFPAMKHLPNWLAKWKREGLAWHARESQMFEGFNQGVRERVVRI